MTANHTHERLERVEEVAGPSNRSFGLVFAGVFVVVALAPLWRGSAPRPWAFAVAGAFTLVALALPRVLAPLNLAWYRLGLLLHRIVTPIVMAALFYLVLTPFAFVMRLFNKGLEQRLRIDRAASTYWVSRRDQPASRMDQQF